MKSSVISILTPVGSLLLSILVIPLAMAALAPGLSPYSAKFPGKRTLENPQGPIPAAVEAFASFRDQIGISWDDEWIYLESNGIPGHPMMTGITAWQQQVPIPHDYTGGNAFRLPLNPQPLEEPGELTLIGPLAIAINGIPIFHALTQSGKDAYVGGELDRWGGHCGRADDYHYHIAPTHLEEIVGKGNPVAFALDGFPIYGSDPARDKPLDECHGYFDDDGKYRYVGELKPPYVLSAFRGRADLDNRPRAGGIRPFLRPLRGARITGFTGTIAYGFHLRYEVNDQPASIEYEITEKGGADFVFRDADGNLREESHEKRAAGKGKGKGKDRPKGKGRPKGGKERPELP